MVTFIVKVSGKDGPEPVHLFVQGHVAVIQNQCVWRFCQGVGRPAGIDVVPFVDVLQDFFQRDVRLFDAHFLQSALGPNDRVCGHEDLQFCIGKYGRTNVPSVHYYATSAPQLVKQFIHKGTDFGDDRHITDLVGDFQGPDLLFNILSVQEGFTAVFSFVVLEADTGVFQHLLHSRQIDGVIGPQYLFAKQLQGCGPVKGSGIDVDVTELCCNLFGKCALPGRGVAVNGDDDSFHIALVHKSTKNIYICREIVKE